MRKSKNWGYGKGANQHLAPNNRMIAFLGSLTQADTLSPSLALEGWNVSLPLYFHKSYSA